MQIAQREPRERQGIQMRPVELQQDCLDLKDALSLPPLEHGARSVHLRYVPLGQDTACHVYARRNDI